MSRTPLGRLAQKLLRSLIWAVLLGCRFISKGISRPWGLRLGSGLGFIAYLLLYQERRRALHHLQSALGGERSPEDRRRIALESFRNLGKTLFEVLTLDRMRPDEIDRLVRFEGEEALKAAAALGRGVIFVTAHIGNWELLAAAVAMRYPLAVVAAPIYDPRAEAMMIRLRAAHGVETLVRDSPGYLKRLFATLCKGGVVGLLIDQDTKTDGVFVPFFHQEAFTPTGAARLAIRTGAAVVTGFILRDSTDRHRVVIRGPLPPTVSGESEQEIRYETARFTKIIENQIRETPEQWIWMHRRWRTEREATEGSSHEPS